MEVEGNICGVEIKWKPVSEILSDSSLNVGNANETMETDTIIISEVEFSRLEMKKAFSMLLRFGHFVWAGEWYHSLR